ncbi:L,D-transpeptidase [Nioella nitratireducens]|uniref:L,D-transpeptidase n=1 Tax=Nioella nitratireducens TaxID=1287720 RepID=UPI0008FD79B7|nr:L,D-transpeptidase [Nioella nitratireducens]
MLTRRHFISTGAALALTPTIAKAQEGWRLPSRFRPHVVEINPGFEPGTIHVDMGAHFLYFVQDGDTAMRFGVAVGREGRQAVGRFRVGRKEEWPSWQPTANMIAREPEVYTQFAGGMEGGPDNPLGARALYLYAGSRDSLLRIHGTPQPWSIGLSASSGCIRMVNDHVIQLYDMVDIGTPVQLHRV